jgi:hypothetical protein
MKELTRYELNVAEAKAIADLIGLDRLDRRVPKEMQAVVREFEDFLRFNVADALETGVGVGIRLKVELI